MPVVDFYSETNQGANWNIDGSGPLDTTALGQSFIGDGGVLKSTKFYLKKVGSPTGNAVAYIYAHSGTFGGDSVPTGSALATSGTLDVSTLTTDYQLIELAFAGANKITLTDDTNFVTVFEYTGGAGVNRLVVGYDNTAASHTGNLSNFASSGGWASVPSDDLVFYVYSEDIVPPVSQPSSRFILDGTQIKRPTSITEDRQSVTALKRMMSGKLGKDLFAGDKRFWKLGYQNVTLDDYTEIYDIYTAYLSSETPVTWQIESSNYEVEQTEVHIDLNVREFSVPGSSYISEFELILVEA